jgi:hypothetical protein
MSAEPPNIGKVLSLGDRFEAKAIPFPSSGAGR